jgi:tetratricopeptide (TPR) repeat protein
VPVILCQKCGTKNPVGDESCYKCGTRLMILPYAYRQNMGMPILDEHFLERISALEYSIGRLDERLNEIYDLVQQLATDSFYDHTMIESIADALKRVQIVGKRDLEKDWQRRVAQRLWESEERERFESSKKAFLNAFRGRDKRLFSKLIEECTQHFLRRRFRQGLKVLERAFTTDPQNCEVGVFLGKIYYEFENFSNSGKCLRKVLKSNPHHFEANLLTGLLAKRKGDYDRAKHYLGNAVDICGTSLAAHLFLGSVLVSLGEDDRALGHFSQALNLKPSPQMHLVVGAIYSRHGLLRFAIKHMKKAIEMDPHCHEAFFQLGLAFLEQNWKRKAKECIQKAVHLNPKESRYKDALDLFQPDPLKTPSLTDLKLSPNLNDESLEFLVKDELRLIFRHPESDLNRSGNDVESN